MVFKRKTLSPTLSLDGEGVYNVGLGKISKLLFFTFPCSFLKDISHYCPKQGQCQIGQQDTIVIRPTYQRPSLMEPGTDSSQQKQEQVGQREPEEGIVLPGLDPLSIHQSRYPSLTSAIGTLDASELIKRARQHEKNEK